MLDIEQWLPCPGFEGFYEVSSWGRVKGLRRMVGAGRGKLRVSRERILKLHPNRKGYPSIRFRIDGQAWTREVHRLVCTAFHGEPPAGMEVAHADGVRNNPRADNLSWKTPAQNAADKERHGTKRDGARHPGAKLSEERARLVYLESLSDRPLRQIAESHGISEANVRRIRNGKLWKKALAGLGVAA